MLYILFLYICIFPLVCSLCVMSISLYHYLRTARIVIVVTWSIFILFILIFSCECFCGELDEKKTYLILLLFKFIKFIVILLNYTILYSLCNIVQVRWCNTFFSSTYNICKLCFYIFYILFILFHKGVCFYVRYCFQDFKILFVYRILCLVRGKQYPID